MPRQRRTRQDKREANRAQILVAARKVFGHGGYHGATIEAIAQEAGLSNGAVYYNFANKEDLFLALLDERIDQRVQHLQRIFDDTSRVDSVPAQIQHEATDLVESLKQSSEWRLLFLEFVIYAARNPAFRVEFVKRREKMKTALTELLAQRAHAQDIDPPVPIEQLVVLLNGLINGLAVEELAEPGAVPDGLLATALTALTQPRGGA